MLGYAERSGQYALKEKLFRNMVICKYESILFSKGFYKAISEENLMKFAKGCPKNLCLDYISDYTRIIPFDIIRKKTDIDKYEIFDNYVILHYDFDNNGTDLPSDKKKEEVEKEKTLFCLVLLQEATNYTSSVTGLTSIAICGSMMW